MTRFGWTAILVTTGSAALSGLALGLVGMSVARSMFVGLNVATMLCYGYDKGLARNLQEEWP